MLAATPTPALINSADQLIQQGIQQYQAGQFTAAIELWQQAETQYRQTQNAAGQAKALFHVGTALVTVERYREAIAALEAFLPLARTIHDQSLEARALSNLGIAYQELGRYSQAIAAHRTAGKLMRTLGDRQSLGQVLTNLGNAFEAVGDYSNALIAYEQGLKIARQLGDRVGESVALGNLGAIYANQGKEREAIAAFEQSLTLARVISYEPGQASALLNLGSTHHGLRQSERAIQYYEESLALARKLGDRRQEATVLGSLGLVLEDRKDYANAIQHHEQSLEIARSLNDLESQAVALNNLGHTFLKAGQLAQAEAALREAVQRLDALRPDLNDRYKVSIFDTQLQTYNLLQQVLIAANKHEEALEAAEWGRARAFAERLAKRVQEVDSGKVAATAAIAPIRIQEIKQIAQKQKATLVEYSVVPDDDFKFRGKQRGRESDLLIWVVQPSGNVHFRRVNLKPLWQQDLNLAKLVTATRNCLYPGADCIVKTNSTPTNASSRSGQPPQRPQRRINPALHRLHQLLIQPIADLLPQNSSNRVIILPLESLFLVPFPALQNAEGHYLIEQHTLLTAPAIQVLALTQQIRQQRQPTIRKRRDRWLPALIVGNPTMPTIGSEELSALPASEEEAKQIASLLKAKALLGKDATQSHVVQKMPHASLIHLATHGLLEYGQALGETDVPGAIALAPDPTPTSKTTPNGILTANEIVDFRLQADLVVLSACDTGRGRITGDGVIGLSRAFISAGVPSIVVSLWAVSDVSTAHLMEQFYQNLLTQPDKAKALRSAMLETMKQYPRPLDWAAFTLVGEAD
ncbi:MAG: CHAT domain-containing protein [Oscillatoriales cyanobacterium C42_A2020_001]|nr:CHAT domain-containing protein [Leptolyngbyaceae cyanobacterium C42_A2020_001]